MDKCIVVGGGIIGLMTARELALAGLKVVLLDRTGIGKECSWAGGGILSSLYPWQMPDRVEELASWSQQYYPLLCEQLLADTRIDPEWCQSGMLVFDSRQRDTAQEWAEKNGRPIQDIRDDQLLCIEPALRRNNGAALLLPDISQVRNPRLIAALKQNLLQLGVELFEFTEAKELIIAHDRAQGVNTSSGKHLADYVVIACGAWSSQLVSEFPVYPVKGQMLCYKATPGYLQHILLRDGHYIIPRKDGHLLIGSTLEEAGYNKIPTEQAHRQLQGVMTSFFADENKMQFVDHWSGLRPATISGLPYIGPYTNVDGLFLNTGHHRNGILLAPGSARLLADIILQRQSFMTVNSFQPVAILPQQLSETQV